MRDLEDIRREIARCDDEILIQLERRMRCIDDVIRYKKIHGIPIFQPAQEEKQQRRLRALAEGNRFEEEILHIFTELREMSKRVQAKALIRGNIALIGFMGTGKTTVSLMLKDMLAMECVDCDQLMEQQEQMTISQIFDMKGEDYFRRRETELLAGFADRRQTVISCGGGAALRRENVDALRRHSRIVLLTASPETILARLDGDDSRPKLRGHKNVPDITAMIAERADKYQAAADITVDTDRKTVLEVCEEIISRPIAIDPEQ
jgi:shikimate kinase/chorismate mutase